MELADNKEQFNKLNGRFDTASEGKSKIDGQKEFSFMSISLKISFIITNNRYQEQKVRPTLKLIIIKVFYFY